MLNPRPTNNHGRAPAPVHLRRVIYGALRLGIPSAVYGFGTPALAASYQVCAKWSIVTDDSGFEIGAGPRDGFGEDQYVSCNSGCDVVARGVRIKAERSGFSTVKDADPTTGCASWTDSGGSGTYDLTVYGYATSALGTVVRIHNASSEACDDIPGSTYSAFIDDAELTPGGSDTWTIPYASKWTAMAVSAFTLYRIGWISGKEINIELEPTWCTTASSHIEDASDFITSGIHCTHLGDTCTSPTQPVTRKKWIVSHELGHAIAALWYGGKAGAANGGEPNMSFSSGITSSGGSNEIPDHCGNGGTFYGHASKEYNSVAFREGFAHFIAARVWNDKDGEGSFGWTNPAIDLERYGPSLPSPSGENDAGGRLENYCCDPAVDSGCTTSWVDSGTNEDYLRLFWDFYTAAATYCVGGTQPGFDDLLDLYAQTRLNGSLQYYNYDVKMDAASDDIGLPACLVTAFDDYQAHNGADH